MIIRCPRSTPRIVSGSDSVAAIFRAILAKESEVDQDKEHFWALGLDTKLRVVYVEIVSLGVLDASLVHPRETFRTAIANGVARMIVAHNHPSGNPQPSVEDFAVTKRLADAGRIIGIQLLDHIVVGETSFVSICEIQPGLF